MDRPWTQYIANRHGNSFERLLAKVPFVPEFVWCVLFRCAFTYKDRAFIAAFIFQNAAWFEPREIGNVIREFNVNWDEARWQQVEGIHTWFSEAAERIANGDEDYRLCQYYAFDLFAQRVLDLRGHVRHFNVPAIGDGRVYHVEDPCRPYLEQYRRFDYVSLDEVVRVMPLCNVSDDETNVVTATEELIRTLDPARESQAPLDDLYYNEEQVYEVLEWLGDNADCFEVPFSVAPSVVVEASESGDSQSSASDREE